MVVTNDEDDEENVDEAEENHRVWMKITTRRGVTIRIKGPVS